LDGLDDQTCRGIGIEPMSHEIGDGVHRGRPRRSPQGGDDPLDQRFG